MDQTAVRFVIVALALIALVSVLGIIFGPTSSIEVHHSLGMLASTCIGALGGILVPAKRDPDPPLIVAVSEKKG